MPSSCELFNEEDLKKTESYKGWYFDVDFKMSENGFPVLREDSDITSISAVYTPDSCYVGEIPTSFGTLIINEKTSMPITEDMISGFDNTSVGKKQVIVNYRGKQTTFFMNVVAPETSQIQNLVISKKPKISYNEGDLFNPSGLSLFGTINGRYVYIYGGYTYLQNPLKASDTIVYINYFGKQIPVNVQVTAKKATSLTILAQSKKTSYTSGEILDLSELRMQITYNTGVKSEIFTSKDFDAYHVRIALGKEKTVKSIRKDYKLQSSDNESSLVFYIDDILPGQPGSISATSTTIRVLSPLEICDSSLHLSENNKNTQYVSTNQVTGGSGNYSTKVISENLQKA